MNYFKNCINLVSIVAAGIMVAGCDSSNHDEGIITDKNEIQLVSITVNGAPVYTFKYDSIGRISEYYDAMFDSRFEISYDPVSIKYTTDDIADDGVLYSYIMNIYDVTLNESGFITEYKIRTTQESPDSEPSVTEGGGICTYDADGRPTRVAYSNGFFINLTWDEQGRLLKTETNTYENTYKSTSIPNTNNQWLPIWYACGGIEITGLFGNAPAMLIESGVQTFTDGTISTAQFDYAISEDDIIHSMMFKEDEKPSVNMLFNYVEQD